MPRLLFNAPAHHKLVVGEKTYHGGDEFTLTGEAAEELLTDPHARVVKASEVSKPVAAAENLEALPRGELDERARKLGIADPGLKPNKDAVIEAIRGQQKPQTNDNEEE